jgi:hypothetical protein
MRMTTAGPTRCEKRRISAHCPSRAPSRQTALLDKAEHCGVDASRPRGHSSLTGAVDAQLAVKRDTAGNVIVEVEWMKGWRGGR